MLVTWVEMLSSRNPERQKYIDNGRDWYVTMYTDFPFCLTNLAPKKNVHFHSLNKMNIEEQQKKHIYDE